MKNIETRAAKEVNFFFYMMKAGRVPKDIFHTAQDQRIESKIKVKEIGKNK